MRLSVRVAAVGLLVAASCGDKKADPTQRLVEVALAAGSNLGFAANVALAALGGPVGCGTPSPACTSYPCTNEITVALSDTCQLPLGGAASGSIKVSGIWSSADTGTITANFPDAKIGGRDVLVSTGTTVLVKRGTSDTTVTYLGQNVAVRGATALAAQSAWTVKIDPAGTPADASDDSYTITGIQQSAGTGDTSQVALTNVKLDPKCRKNPVDGLAIIQKAGSTVDQRVINFHAACDGKMDSIGLTLPGGAVLDYTNR